MVDSLDSWSSRLKSHFAALHEARKRTGLPIFALEHGLSESDLAAVSQLLQSELRYGQDLGKHWLVWTAYAAEQGYNYEGAEFWTTFEKRTPKWRQCGNRNFVRQWFVQFHQTYNGVLPTGPWAGQFTIICWPIAHAVLPRDLQNQLAALLYSLRYQLPRIINNEAAEIGRYLAEASYDASSRFKNLLEQEELVGNLVLTMLADRATLTDQVFHPATLDRIITDLEKTRKAKEWLKEARNAVEVARITGVARQQERAAEIAKAEAENEKKAGAISIRPILRLHRIAKNEWQPLVEIPNFGEIAYLSPQIRTFLKSTRCSIQAVAGPRPSGWLLAGPHCLSLSKWPDFNIPIVGLEGAPAVLDSILQADGCITRGPIWVFKVGPDGSAREVTTKLVRPGTDYLILSNSRLDLGGIAEEAVVICDEILGSKLKVPTSLNFEQTELLKSVGLSVAQTISIQPSALPARAWDGEGHTEWLINETPSFMITHDCDVTAMSINLSGDSTLRLAGGSPGKPNFIQLPDLKIGHYTLTVRAEGAQQQVVEGMVSVLVRHPDVWKPGTTVHSGLVAYLDPPTPTLDAFWEGQVDGQVLGPAGRSAKILVQLLSASGEILSTSEVGNAAFPFSGEAWSRMLGEFSKRERDPWAYLSATSGRVLIDGNELGLISFPLSREADPVRWIWSSQGSTPVLRLIDDTSQEEELTIHCFAFDNPVMAQTQDTDTCRTGFAPAAPGGLYVADCGTRRRTIIAGVSLTASSFSSLAVEPDLTNLAGSDQSLVQVLDALDLWKTGWLIGPLATYRRDRVVDRLNRWLVQAFCGDAWSEAEAAWVGAGYTDIALERLAGCIEGKAAFAFILRRDGRNFADATHDQILAFLFDKAKRYGVCGEPLACDAALRLQQSPGDMRKWAGKKFITYLAALQANPSLVRGARLLTLLGDLARAEMSSVTRAFQ